MSFDPSRIKGYSPSLEEIFEEMRIDSPNEFRETMFSKCRELYKKSNIKKFKNQNFIICDSSEFYKTFVNMGYGNSALIIKDDYSPEKYFLMFKDKVPERFYEIVAEHETTEYENVCSGIGQPDAHINASRAEIDKAKEIGEYNNYIKFLKEKYPLKLKEIKKL